jgi:hypothetical protein
VSKEEVYSTFDGKDTNYRPHELTIDTTDEYNAMVCISKRDTAEADQSRCPSPTDSTNCGGGTVWPNPIEGYLECRHLWIEGWGSSTYNSDVFNGVASASGPVNVGSVQKIHLGPIGPRLRPPLPGVSPSRHIAYGSGFSLTALDGYTGGFAPHPDSAVARMAICFTSHAPSAGGSFGPGCKLIEFVPASHVWQFNAPVDCVNGYGCVNSRRLNATAA